MEPNRRRHRLLGRDALPQQGEDHPCQHITAAPFGHARVAGGVEEGIPIGEGCDGPVAFQHQDAAVLLGKRQGGRLPVGANGLPLPQPEKFPVVRGHHRQPAASGVQNIYMLCYGVYAVCIQDQRSGDLRHQMAGAHVRGPASPQPRTNENAVTLVHLLQEFGIGGNGGRHSLLAFHRQHRPNLLGYGEGHQPRTGASEAKAGAPVNPTLPARICTFPKVPL